MHVCTTVQPYLNTFQLLINTRKNQATVSFDDHRSAKKAKEKGAAVSPQAPPIEIIHYLKRRRSSDSTKRTTPTFSSVEVACNFNFKFNYILYLISCFVFGTIKVDEELAAMSGTDAFSYATNTAVGAATSSRIIGERELRSLPLKKKKQGRITTSTFKKKLPFRCY